MNPISSDSRKAHSAEGPLTRLVRQSAVALVGGILGRLQYFLASVLVFRTLDDVAVGEIQLALVLGTYVALIPELGLRGLALRRLAAVASDPGETARTVAAFLWIRLVAMVLTQVLAMGIFPALGYPPSTVWLASGFTLFCMLDGLATLQKFSFRGLGSVAPDVWGGLVGRGAVLAATATALLWDPRTETVLAAFLFGILVEVLLLTALQVRSLGWRVLHPPTPAWGWAVLVQALPFVGFMIVQTLNQGLGRLVLSFQQGLSGPDGSPLTREAVLQQIGAFGAAYRISEALMFFPVAMSSLLVPALVRLNQDSAGSRRVSQSSLRMMVVLGGLMALALVLMRQPLAAMMGNGKYSGETATFACLGAWTGIMVIQFATLNMLIAQGIFRPIYWRYGVAIAANGIITWYWGPLYGALAAAMALTLSDTLGVISDFHALWTRTELLSGTLLRDCLIGMALLGGILTAIIVYAGSHQMALTGFAALYLAVLAWIIGPELPPIMHRIRKMRTGKQNCD